MKDQLSVDFIIEKFQKIRQNFEDNKKEKINEEVMIESIETIDIDDLKEFTKVNNNDNSFKYFNFNLSKYFLPDIHVNIH